MPDRTQSVVAFGASAGGVEALRQVIGELPRDLGAPALVVLHTAPVRRSYLPGILSRALAGYVVRERPRLALEVTLPDAVGTTLSSLLSRISDCLEENRLEPVTIELADETYVLGDGAPVRNGG